MIRLENLSLKLKENEFLVNNINLFIPSGHLISITGPPGSGKTKLFKVLGLQEKASNGNLYILGKNTKKLDRDEIAHLHNEISLVEETNDLIYNIGVKENIILPLISMNKRKEDIEIALNELVSWLKIENILKKNISRLSHYEQKVVQFSRAIITRPRILLLDNFFLNIDSEIQKKTSFLLLALKKIGTTIINFSYHDTDNFLEYNDSYKIQNLSLIKI